MSEPTSTEPPRQIVLVGLSGVGKSTVGAVLAERLGWPLIDTDELIEAQEGQTAAQLIVDRGEAEFRSIEERVVIDAAREHDRAVIATGGGAFMSPKSRRALGERGLICYLDATTAEVARRIRAAPDASERPLLGDELEGRLQELDDERRPFYAHADLWVPVLGVEPEAVAQRILVSFAAGAGAFAGGEQRLSRLAASAPAAAPSAIVDTGTDRYPIWVGAGELDRLADRLRQVGLNGRVFVITDTHVIDELGPKLVAALDRGGFAGASYVVPPGEESKQLRVAEEIYAWLGNEHAERGDTLLALGGGVVGDLAGHVAATYLRGMPLVQVPTTVLAMNDAAIGGKVAVNLEAGKNLVGSFHQPRAVIADIEVLRTLPRRAYTEGFAEVLKHALIMDPLLLADLERSVGQLATTQPDEELLTRVITRSARLKALVVSSDPREQGLRAMLNYGHTIGHAIEAATGYGEYLHGEAVAIGMMGAARLGHRLGVHDDEIVARQADLLRAYELPLTAPGLSIDDVMQAMRLDKKVQEGRLRFVFLEAFGRPILRDDVPEDAVREVLKKLLAG